MTTCLEVTAAELLGGLESRVDYPLDAALQLLTKVAEHGRPAGQHNVLKEGTRLDVQSLYIVLSIAALKWCGFLTKIRREPHCLLSHQKHVA